MSMSFLGRAFVCGAVASAALLVACGESPEDAPQGSASSGSSRPKTKVGALPPEMVAAVPAGRSATAVGLHFALGTAPQVDKALPVEIIVLPERAFDSLRVHFEGNDDLVVTVGQDFGPQTKAAANKMLKHQLVLLPKHEGLHMVTASVDTESDEGNVVRSFSIPVIILPTAAPPPAVPANK